MEPWVKANAKADGADLLSVCQCKIARDVKFCFDNCASVGIKCTGDL